MFRGWWPNQGSYYFPGGNYFVTSISQGATRWVLAVEDLERELTSLWTETKPGPLLSPQAPLSLPLPSSFEAWAMSLGWRLFPEIMGDTD